MINKYSPKKEQKISWKSKYIHDYKQHSKASVRDVIGSFFKKQPTIKNPPNTSNPAIPDLTTARILARKCSKLKNEINWELSFAEYEFVVFDSETTGFFPHKGDEIISLGAVIVKNGKIDDNKAFDRLINPKRKIPQDIVELTGINNEMVAREPRAGIILAEFLSFISNRVLIAHHAAFDLAFINLKLNWYCQGKIYNPVIDTLELARALEPAIGKHDLDYLADYFSIDIQGRHTALGDSIITAKLFLILLEELRKRNITTLKQLHYFITAQSNLYNQS